MKNEGCKNPNGGKMLLTAHSGANGTPANEVGYFEAMKNVNVDVIEIDIRRIFGEYYLTHDRTLFPKKKGLLPLSYAFDFVKQYDFKVNCDLKKEGYVADVLDLAEKMGVQDRIIITGSACEKNDLSAVRFGDLYVNPDYLPKLTPRSVPEIKRILKSMGPCAKGINISYKKTSDEFLVRCAEENVPVSLFTVNDKNLLKKYAAFPAIVNITTCIADEALTIFGREIKK